MCNDVVRNQIITLSHTGISVLGLSGEDNSVINLESNYPHKFWADSYSYRMRSTYMDCCSVNISSSLILG